MTCRAAASTSSGRSDSPHLRLAWDPANFVQVGVRPYTEGYADAPPAPRVHADQGRAGGGRHGRDRRATATVRSRETIRALRHDGFDGFFSLEPHLGAHELVRRASPAPSCSAQAWQRLHRPSDRAEGIEYA